MFADRIACPTSEIVSIHRAALPAFNMLREDANCLAFGPTVLLKRIGRDKLDRVAQPFELRLPFVGPGALLTVQVVQRATAYFTVDDSLQRASS